MRQRGTRRPTVKDVAKLAGVSWMTVSRVVNDAPGVGEETRLAVRRAIADLGYIPNRAAASLPSANNRMVALLLPDMASTIFHDIYRGVNEVMERAGRLVIVGESHYNPEREEMLARGMLGWQPAAFVFSNILVAAQTEKLLAGAGIPVCMLSDPDFKADSMLVGYSSFRIGATVARLLFRLGKRRVAHVRATRSYTRNTERMLAGAQSIEPDFPGHKVTAIGMPLSSPLSFADGAAVVRSLLGKDGLAHDALFFANDIPATGAVFECQRLGIRIPEDLAIVGFGDSELAAQISPPLTSVRVNADSMGRVAGELLLGVLAGEATDTSPRLINFELILRETT